MDSSQWLRAAPLVLLLGGCHGGVETEVLERELRRQEDYIYQLQDQVEQYRMALDERGQDGAGQQPTPAGRGTTTGRNGGPSPTPSAPPDDLPSADELKPPPVELGTPVEPPARKSTDGPPDAAPANAPDAGLEGPEMMPSAADARQVERIVLRTSTPRRAGLKAIVQRHSANGQVAPVQGSISLMVLGEAHAGRKQRIARWDFSAAQINAQRLQSAKDRGLQLDLPWPDGPPAPGRYELWGRLLAADGKKLLTSLPVDVDRGGRVRVAVVAPVARSKPRRPAVADKALAAASPDTGARHAASPPAQPPRTPPTQSTASASPMAPPPAASPPTGRGQQPPSATAGRPTWKPYR